MNYDKKYWDWQKEVGKIGGKLNKFKFQEHITKNDHILDFGCGGGFLLKELDCQNKIGFEINEHAKQHASDIGIKTVSNWSDVADESLDVVISNHALEHVLSPFETLLEIKKKLKSEKYAIFVLPCEQPYQEGFNYNENDKNFHVYTWCPQTIGNLFKAAGYKVESCGIFFHSWPPDWETTYNNKDIHKRCVNHAHQTKTFQIKIVARKI